MNYELGVMHEQAQDFAHAETAFAAVARLLDNSEALLERGPFTREEVDSQAVEVYERLGKVCIRATEYERATAAFLKARNKVKDPVRARRLNYNLAEVYVAQNKLSEALDSLDQYLVTQPQGVEAYELKIKILTQLGRQDEILPALQTHVERDSQNVSLKLLQAKQYGLAGQNDRAETIYVALAMQTPTPDVYKALFTLYKNDVRQGPSKVLDLLDSTLGAASSKKEEPGNPAEAPKARAMLIALRDDAEMVKALLPAAQRQLSAGAHLHYETCSFLAVLATRAKQLEAAEQLFRTCLDNLPQG